MTRIQKVALYVAVIPAVFSWGLLAVHLIRKADRLIEQLRTEVVQRDMLIETLKTDLSTAESVYETQLQQQQAGARAILNHLQLQNQILQQNLEREVGKSWL